MRNYIRLCLWDEVGTNIIVYGVRFIHRPKRLQDSHITIPLRRYIIILGDMDPEDVIRTKFSNIHDMTFDKVEEG